MENVMRLTPLILFALLVISTAYSQNADWIVYNTDNSGISCDTIYQIVYDNNDNLWVTTQNGLSKFDGSNWEAYNTDNSRLPHNRCHRLSLDSNGGLWVSCPDWDNGGLVNIDGTNWQVYTSGNSRLPHNDIRSLTTDALGNVWLGTFRGLVRIERFNWEVYDAYSLRSVAYDGYGNVWAGYWGVLQKINMNDLRYKNYFFGEVDGNPNHVYGSLYPDKEGSIWMHAQQLPDYNPTGLAKLSGNSWDWYHTGNSGIPTNRVGPIVEDDEGYLWMGSAEGLIRFDQKEDEWVLLTTDNSGLPSNKINSLMFDKNQNLWVSTPNGLAVYKDGGVVLTDINDGLLAELEVTCNPNPFTEFSIFNFQLSKPGNVSLKIYDALGVEIAVLVNEFQDAGEHQAVFDGSNLAAGIYYYTLQVGERIESGRLVKY